MYREKEKRDVDVIELEFETLEDLGTNRLI
jgi:hypothetical protein